MKKNKDNVIPFINKISLQAKIVAGAFVVLFLIICLVNVYSANKVFAGYEIEKSVTRDDGKNASYLEYADGYIRYSNDGIAYYKQNGNVVWNHTYEINTVQVKTSGEYIVVGNISGRNLYVYNKQGLKCEIDAALPITQVDVASQGVTAVALEDGNTNYINMYDNLGNKLSYIITTLTGDGYPIDMALSDDGYKLAVAYVSINGETVENNLAFYNFSDVGQNSIDRLVGGFNHYGESLIGKVEFIDNDTVLAVAEDRASVYNIVQYPKLSNEITFDEPLQKIAYSSKYIGLIFNNVGEINKYVMKVYNTSGNKISEIEFNEEYRNYEFVDDRIMMYNDSLFSLLTVKGKKRYEDSFDMNIEKIMALDTSQRFLIFNSKYIQQIKLN